MKRLHSNFARFALAPLIALAGLTVPFTSSAETPFASWFHQFDPNVGSSPSANATAIDRSGFVAVGGYTWSGARRVFYVAIHDPFTGQYVQGWPKVIDPGGGSGSHEVNDVTFDSVGNLIVTGQSQSADGLDYLTIKYSRLGVEQWSKRYDNTGGADQAFHVAVDSANHVYVTGESSDTVSGDDIYTVKYQASNGDVLSEFRYNNGGNRPDSPTGLAIDSQNKVIVCGVTRNAAGNDDMYLAKYTMTAMAGTADWTRTIDSENNSGGSDTAWDVAVGPLDSVTVVGLRRRTNNEHGFYARRYTSTGSDVGGWTQTFPLVDGDFLEGARGVAVDAAGNAFVTGFHEFDNNNTTIYTAKLVAASGAIDWSIAAPLFADEDADVDDTTPPLPVCIALDPAGNPIVASSTRFGSDSSDFYIAKYSSNNEGAILWERFFAGAFPNGGTDRVQDMAVDSFGNIAIAGDALREAGTLFEIITFKIGATALATGDPISGPGIPEGAIISQLFPPAASDSGGIAARITAAAGRKKVGAIVTIVGGRGLQFPAVQGLDAPGISGATFKSFLDPVLAPNGEVAFIGKVAGTKGSESTGVWTNAFSGDGSVQLALQQGKQVPGMPTGTFLKSITSLSHRDNQLVALIKVTGAAGGVTGANSLVLYRLNGIGTGIVLLRTNDPITVGGTDSTIKKITVFTPPKDSAGHGRYHGAARAIAKVTLADKRTAIVTIDNTGAGAVITHTAANASTIASGALWSTMNLPAIDGSGSRYGTLGTLQVGDGDVDKSNDTFIGVMAQGGSFTKVAREGDDTPGITGGKFATLGDPLVSFSTSSRVAFLGTAKGAGISASNRTGLWFGTLVAPALIARANHENFPATDGAGNALDARWTSFKSIALPNGPSEGPLFIATIAGPDASKKTGTGLWARDSSGLIRKLIRVGDQIGDATVKKFTVLTPVAGSIGATRSFSPTRSVAILVALSNKTTGIINIGIP